MAVIDPRGQPSSKQQQLMLMAQFFAQMGERQREEAAAKQQSEQQAQKDKRDQIASLLDFAVKNGQFDMAEQLASQIGMPQGFFTEMGARSQQDAAAKAEADRMKQEASDTRLMGLTNPTNPSVFGTMTDQSSGIPGFMPPQTNVWETETGIDPAQAEVIAGIDYKMTPEQLQSFRTMSVSPEDRVRAIKMELGLEQTADESAKLDIDRGKLDVDRGRLGLDREKFGYEQAQDTKKAAAETLKTAAASGLPPEEYKNLSSLLDDVRAAVKPQVDALALGKTMAGALESGNAEVAQAAMVSFMKALDDSVAREGEVAAMVNKMGGIVGIRNKLTSFVSGKADNEFNEKMKGLINLVNTKNTALINERLSGFDVQADAAGPNVLPYYQKFRSTILGAGSAPPPKRGVGGSAGSNIVPASDLP